MYCIDHIPLPHQQNVFLYLEASGSLEENLEVVNQNCRVVKFQSWLDRISSLQVHLAVPWSTGAMPWYSCEYLILILEAPWIAVEQAENNDRFFRNTTGALILYLLLIVQWFSEVMFLVCIWIHIWMYSSSDPPTHPISEVAAGCTCGHCKACLMMTIE
jgi:hypothetical protein